MAHKTATLALVLALGLFMAAQPAVAQYGYYYGTPGSYGRRLLSVEDLQGEQTPLFARTGRSLLQSYGPSYYGYGGSYGRRLLSTSTSTSTSTSSADLSESTPLFSRPRRNLLQYGGGYGYGYYGR